MSDFTLYMGDCLDILQKVNVDAVVGDPPYGIKHSTGWVKMSDNPEYNALRETWNNGNISGDESTELRDTVVRWASGMPCALFGSWKRKYPIGTHTVLVWDKGPASGMGDLSIPWKPSWEEIYIIGKGWRGFRSEGVLKGHNVGTHINLGRTHPNEKPVSLMIALIEKLPKNYTIFDPFMGTGATGVACMKMGMNFIGCEIDPEYYAIAEKRIAAAQAQLPMLLQTGAEPNNVLQPTADPAEVENHSHQPGLL